MNQEEIKYVSVYGGLHSPWVQAVLLGLYEKNIQHSVQPLPSFSSLLRSGVMMPAAKINEQPWQLDSAGILESLGFDAIDREDKKAIVRTWNGVLHRVENPLKFFHGFSLNKDFHPSLFLRLLRNFLRPFITFYFFTLINFLILSGRRNDPDSFADQFLPWERCLTETGSPFFGGNSPNSVDLQLFGIVQCHCSIPHAPLIKTLQSDPKLPRYRNGSHGCKNVSQITIICIPVRTSNQAHPRRSAPASWNNSLFGWAHSPCFYCCHLPCLPS